jgi:hypothetical protein
VARAVSLNLCCKTYGKAETVPESSKKGWGLGKTKRVSVWA